MFAGLFFLLLEDFMDSCIYILYWDISYPYIGQTTNFNIRKNRHINEILKNTHCNYKIIEEYNKYSRLPSIEVLHKCSIEKLNELEEQYISEFNSIDSGLNIISGGYSVGCGTNNPSSKYTKEQLKIAFYMLSDVSNSYKYIATETNIKLDTIKKIGQGTQHTWLHSEYPEIYEKIKMISTKERYKNSACASGQNKKYRKIMSPDGTIYTVTNTLAFSKEHNLPNANLCSVLLGNRHTVQGWKGVDV